LRGKIHVNLVKDKNGEGVLVRLKSRTKTLAIQDDSDVATLLEKAIDKHARHHQHLTKKVNTLSFIMKCQL
jgi:hypothetical protein